MAKYYVTANSLDNRIYEFDKLNDAIKAAKNELNKSGIRKTYVKKEGDNTFTRSYTHETCTPVRIKHPQLIKDDNGKICADLKSQNKHRDTSARYCFEDNTLVVGGKLVEKHPKFANIDKFEDWVMRYFAEGKDGYKCE